MPMKPETEEQLPCTGCIFDNGCPKKNCRALVDWRAQQTHVRPKDEVPSGPIYIEVDFDVDPFEGCKFQAPDYDIDGCTDGTGTCRLGDGRLNCPKCGPRGASKQVAPADCPLRTRIVIVRKKEQ